MLYLLYKYILHCIILCAVSHIYDFEIFRYEKYISYYRRLTSAPQKLVPSHQNYKLTSRRSPISFKLTQLVTAKPFYCIHISFAYLHQTTICQGWKNVVFYSVSQFANLKLIIRALPYRSYFRFTLPLTLPLQTSMRSLSNCIDYSIYPRSLGAIIGSNYTCHTLLLGEVLHSLGYITVVYSRR